MDGKQTVHARKLFACNDIKNATLQTIDIVRYAAIVHPSMVSHSKAGKRKVVAGQ